MDGELLLADQGSVEPLAFVHVGVWEAGLHRRSRSSYE